MSTNKGEGRGTAALYLRISSDPSGQAAGVARQQAECEELAARMGLDVVRIFEDNDRSAYSGKPRPAFEAMLAEARNGTFAYVLAFAADRLFRRMADLLRVVDELSPYAEIATVTGGGRIDLNTAEGRMHAKMLGTIAEFESEHKGDRIRSRAAERARQGRMTTSTRPFGWRWANPCPGEPECRHRTVCEPGQRSRLGARGGLVLDDFEAPIIAEAYRRIAEGASLRSTWKYVSGAGVPVADASVLRGVMLNPRNCGMVAHRGEIVAEAADGLSLIDKDTFDAVGVILRDPSRRTSPGRPVATPLGGGLMRCGKCGGNMAASTRRESNGERVPIYICVVKQDTGRRRDLLDGPLLDAVGDLLGTWADTGLLTAITTADPATDALREEIKAQETKMAQLDELLDVDEIDVGDWSRITKRLRARLDELTASLANRTTKHALAGMAAADGGVMADYARLRQVAEDGDTDPLRALLAEVLDRVVLDAEGTMTCHWADWTRLGVTVVAPLRKVSMPRMRRREQVAELYAAGVNKSEIARTLEVNRKTVEQDVAAMGLKPPVRPTLTPGAGAGTPTAERRVQSLKLRAEGFSVPMIGAYFAVTPECIRWDLKRGAAA